MDDRESFDIPNCRALRRRGLGGYEVGVRLDGNTLVFTDEEGRSAAVSATRVALLRHFRMEEVHGRVSSPLMYETKIWSEGGGPPILVVPMGDFPAYRAAMRSFIGQVAAAKGLDRIRLGPGYTTAIVNLLLVAPISLALCAYVIWVATLDGGWWWVIGIAIVLFFAWLVGRNVISRWPRRLRSLDRLDAELQ